MGGFEIIGPHGPRTRSKRYVYDMEGRRLPSMIRGREEVWVVQPGRYVIVDVDWKRKKRMYRAAFWCVEISDCMEYGNHGTRCRVGYVKLLEGKQGTPDIREDDVQKAVSMCREKVEVR
jgi:hypothetical protein